MVADYEYEFAPRTGFAKSLKRAADGKFYFDQNEFNSLKRLSLSTVTTGAVTMGTIATGKLFHLRTVVITNATGKKGTTVSFRNQSATGTIFLKLRVMSGTVKDGSRVENFNDGYVFDTAIFVQLSSAATGLHVSVGGVLDPQATAGGS